MQTSSSILTTTAARAANCARVAIWIRVAGRARARRVEAAAWEQRGRQGGEDCARGEGARGVKWGKDWVNGVGLGAKGGELTWQHLLLPSVVSAGGRRDMSCAAGAANWLQVFVLLRRASDVGGCGMPVGTLMGGSTVRNSVVRQFTDGGVKSAMSSTANVAQTDIARGSMAGLSQNGYGCIQKHFERIQKIFVCIHKISVWPHLRKQNSNIGAAASGRRSYKRGRRPSAAAPLL